MTKRLKINPHLPLASLISAWPRSLLRVRIISTRWTHSEADTLHQLGAPQGRFSPESSVARPCRNEDRSFLKEKLWSLVEKKQREACSWSLLNEPSPSPEPQQAFKRCSRTQGRLHSSDYCHIKKIVVLSKTSAAVLFSKSCKNL